MPPVAPPEEVLSRLLPLLFSLCVSTTGEGEGGSAIRGVLCIELGIGDSRGACFFSDSCAPALTDTERER